MSVQVGYGKQVTLCIILLFFIFCVIELGSQFYEYFLQNCGILEFPEYDEYDYFLKRHICYDQHLLTYSNSPVLTIVPDQHFRTININDNGFRGPEINTTKMVQDYRIIMIGGSTVFGAGLPSDNQSIPHELNKKFQETYENVEVINAGISSITSFQELYHFKEKLIHLDPDMVIIYDGHNDIDHGIINPKIENMDDESDLNFLWEYIRSPVVIYRYVLLPIINMQIMNTSDMIPNSVSDDYNPELSSSLTTLWYNHMNEFCQISNERNIEPIVIIQPTLEQNKKPLSSYEQSFYVKNTHVEKTFDSLIQKSNDLRNCSGVYDFTHVFENVPSTLYMDNVHITPHGNKIISTQIYEKISPIVSKEMNSRQ